jgi:hypothetical protein
MAPEWGYSESFARKVGKLRICASCDYELTNRKYLRISETHYLLASGKVVDTLPPQLA